MTLLPLSPAFMDRLGWVLVHSVWQFALIALAAMMLERVMRRSSSAARYWALLVALGAMAVAPVATWLAIPDETRAAAALAASNESLNLRKTQITDAGVRVLKEIKSLESVNLWGTRVTEVGLSELAHL